MALTWPRLTSRRERAGGLRARGFVGRYAALLGKELRLQAPTLLFSGMFVTAWLVSQAFGRVLPESWAAVTAGFAVFHGMVVALLAGALVGAEERQMGTLVSQFQLPMAVWRQWLIKVVVALTVGLVLSVGLPLTLGAILPVPGREAFHSLARNIDAFAASAVLLGVAGILASSVATSGLRAAIAASRFERPASFHCHFLAVGEFAPVEIEVLQSALERHRYDAAAALRMIFGGEIPRVVQGVRA